MHQSWLVVKEAKFQHANELFNDTNVTSDCHSYLGDYIGTNAARAKYAKELVEKSQTAYAAFVIGF